MGWPEISMKLQVSDEIRKFGFILFYLVLKVNQMMEMVLIRRQIFLPLKYF